MNFRLLAVKLSKILHFHSSVYVAVKVESPLCYEVRSYCILTPWSGALLENLTGSQLVKKFPQFYGTRMFITAFSSAQHMSLS